MADKTYIIVEIDCFYPNIRSPYVSPLWRHSIYQYYFLLEH